MTKSIIRLPTQVAQNLLERIINQEILPGSAMPTERELQEQYSVSRTVVREAMKSLEARGLIAHNGGQGAVVSTSLIEPSIQALMLAFHRTHVTTGDMLITRMLLEPQIAATAATAATDVQVRRLYAINRSTSSMLAASNIQYSAKIHVAWASADSRFHVTLAEASQNPLLTILVEILVGIAWQQRGQDSESITISQMQVAAEQHNAIAHAVANHDVDRAREGMIAHLESTRTYLTSQPDGLQQLIDIRID